MTRANQIDSIAMSSVSVLFWIEENKKGAEFSLQMLKDLNRPEWTVSRHRLQLDGAHVAMTRGALPDAKVLIWDDGEGLCFQHETYSEAVDAITHVVRELSRAMDRSFVATDIQLRCSFTMMTNISPTRT